MPEEVQQFMRHDLVWISENDLPYVVTTQIQQGGSILNVAQCLTPEKTVTSRVATTIAKSSVVRHEKPLRFLTLLQDSLTMSNSDKLYDLFSNMSQRKIGIVKKVFKYIAKEGVEIRIYGSCSWQFFTRRQFIHRNSDVDLLVYISDYSYLDDLYNLLNYSSSSFNRKLDVEVVLDNQYFVALQEWMSSSKQILVKTNYQQFLSTKEDLITLINGWK